MRADKPIGTMLLMWPTLWALWIAGAGSPDWTITIIFILGVFLMRSAGCVINDFADRNIDPFVTRTKTRPLASGDASAKEAIILFTVLCSLAFGLVLMTNKLTILLSFVAVLLAGIYPFMKRYTYWPQIFLGAAFSMAIPMAFAAQLSEIPNGAWLIFIANICWVVAYDTMYAMVDREDDLRIGVKSTAVLFGKYERHFTAFFQASFLSLMVLSGYTFGLGVFYYVGLFIAFILIVYHQMLIFQRDAKLCFNAFLNNNVLGGVIFLSIFLDISL